MEELPDAGLLRLDATVFIDNVFLDGAERRLFARSTHEYLIEQLQRETFENIIQAKYQTRLTFFHSCKELIWVVQKRSFTINEDGYTELRWDNYSVSEENVGNPIVTSKLDFNNYTISDEYEWKYYNYQ